MALKSMTISPDIKPKRLFVSLALIFVGAVITSKSDSWFFIIVGALIAVYGCFLNQKSVLRLSKDKDKKK